jgi:hypothetical protein
MKRILFICCLLITPAVWTMDQDQSEPEQEVQQRVDDTTEPHSLASGSATVTKLSEILRINSVKNSCCVCGKKSYLERAMSGDDICHMYVCLGCLIDSAVNKPDRGGYAEDLSTWVFTDKFSCKTCEGEVYIRNRHNYRNF